MGTHPIFESDFDCLTDMSHVSRAGNSLAGKVVFVTGASRGIGLSIAKKCAQDGAKVAVVSKTSSSHSTLPGTIFTASEEITELGGQALPIKTDIRFEDEVIKAVETTVDQFGGIDIVVNNASAISVTNTVETEMKKYDLMHEINGRGTFLVSKLCIPYLIESEKKGNNPHILNISPVCFIYFNRY